jgi:anti-sigma28 factor (negative regulator of flagellin synthesis)
MSVNEISGSGVPVQSNQPRKVKDDRQSRAASQDRIEVSGEARELFETEQTKRLSEIQRRIEEGFYKRREVMERVVDAILKDIQ